MDQKDEQSLQLPPLVDVPIFNALQVIFTINICIYFIKYNLSAENFKYFLNYRKLPQMLNLM